MDKRVWDEQPMEAFTTWIDGVRLKHGAGYNERSRGVYTAMWGKYVRFLAARRVPVSQATADTIRTFLETESPRPASGKSGRPQATTQRRYLGLLSNVYQFLKETGIKSYDPAAELIPLYRAPATKPTPVILSRQQEETFVEALPPGASWKRIRDHAMMHLILGSGLRISEALDLTLNQVYLSPDNSDEAPFIHIPANGPHKERVAPLAPQSRVPFLTWLTLRDSLEIPGKLAFPASLAGDAPLNASTIYRQVKTALKRAGIEKAHMGPHVLRHTFATRQLAHGRPISVVRNWLGHEWDESTAIYRRLIVNPDGMDAV